MSEQTDYPQTAQVLEGEPALSTGFYSSGQTTSEARAEVARGETKGDKPTHYKVICISMYTKDLKRLDDMVDSLKARGMTKANRSALIRYALAEVDLDSVPQGL
jgi:hypothetical protein